MRTSTALLSCLLPLAALLGACSSAGKCTRGEPGCACMQDTCASGASCLKGMCVVSEAGIVRDAGSKMDAGQKKDAGSKIDAGQKIDAGSKTDAGKKDAGSKTDAGTVRRDAGPPVTCPSDSIDSACRSFCQAFCRNLESLCVSSKCPAGACDPTGDVYKECSKTCGTDVACAHDSCVAEGKRVCEEFGYSDSSTAGVFLAFCLNDDPVCVLNPDFGCSDTCGSLPNHSGGDLASNGQCEDQGAGSTSGNCERGTDCTDCKPRVCTKTAGSCSNNGDCCGYYTKKSLCVDTGGGGQCLATCVDTTTCPGTQTCRTATDSAGKAFHVCAP